MGAFLHGFSHGFHHGMFHEMFGGPCYAMYPFAWGHSCCNPFMPTFMMPNFSFGGFPYYQMPMFNVFPTFAFNNFNYDSFGGNYMGFNNFESIFNAKLNMCAFPSSFYVPSFSIKGSDVISDLEPEKDVVIETSAEALKDKWTAKKPHLSKEFYNKVVKISKRLNCDPNELMAVMNCESGIKHTAVNKKSNATGLIQFMPETAKSLGTSVNELKLMSAEKQLDYVEKYLEKQKKIAGFADNHKLSAGELYALVFLPARAKREVLTTNDEKYYSWNKGLDTNKDGKITKSDLDARVKTNIMA